MSALVALDVALLRFARTAWHPPAAELAIARMSALGEHGAIWLTIGVGAGALDPAHRRAWRRATVTVAAGHLLNSLIKLAVRRPRPQLPGRPALVSTPTGLSFPSAHATTSFTAARAYGRLGLPRPPLYVLAGALGLSRVYLGVHYPSDVLAGAVLGTALGSLA